MVEETNDNKWENPEAVNDPELDLERLGDEGEECSKTMPIEHCNENEDAKHWNEEKIPNNDVEKSRLSCVEDPAEAEKKEKKVETRKLKLDEIPEGSPEH